MDRGDVRRAPGGRRRSAEVSSAAQALPPLAHPPRLADLLLDSLALLVTEGRSAAAPRLRQAASAFASRDISPEEDLRWGWLAQPAAIVLWDEDGWHAIAVQQTQLARDVGALDQLPIDLASEAATVKRLGAFRRGLLIAEADVVSEATGIGYPPFAALWFACLSGKEAEATVLIEATIAEGTAGGQGHAVSFAQCVAAILTTASAVTPTRWPQRSKPARTPPSCMSQCGRCPN